jgi:hypothetical protein
MVRINNNNQKQLAAVQYAILPAEVFNDFQINGGYVHGNENKAPLF